LSDPVSWSGRRWLNHHLALLRLGDWLMVLLGLLLVVWLMQHFWLTAPADHVVVRQGGHVFCQSTLLTDRDIRVPGPLGVTQIQIRHHRVRVVSDPGPRQLCVREGWISRAGEAAICLPNQVSVEIIGLQRDYDSLSY